MSTGASPGLFRFGLFEADLQNVRLTRKGVGIRLQEQPFRILAILLEHSGQIVTREDLQRALWPAGTYVSFDASLNMALNRLRAALDDDADNPRFIETVPKRGYRFIAPIALEDSPAPLEAEIPPSRPSFPLEKPPVTDLSSSEPGPSARGLLLELGAAAVALLIAATSFFVFHKRAHVPTASTEQPSVDIGQLRRSAAVLGFQNASGRPNDAWLSTALAEMLRTELGAGGKLRVVSGEDVAQYRAGAPWSETDSLSQPTTARIGKAFDSDLLVLGSFAAVRNAPGDDSIRVDFRLQDAKTGKILYEGAESGSEKQFFGLAATIGTDLRERLGLSMISESEEAGVVSSLPSDPDANRLYSLGLAELRDADVATAKDLLLQAEKLAPHFPLVHLMLYRAWAGLGYDQKAKDEIKIAYLLSSGVPEVDKLQIEGAYYQSLKEHEKAISVYRALYTLYPDSLDYAVQLIALLNNPAHRLEALAIVKRLRKLPPPASEDPRIDYWQGTLIASVGNSIGQPYVEKAAAEAASHGQKLLYAYFRLHQCRGTVYSDHPQGGAAYCKEAYDIYMAAGNPLYAADALRTMGDRRGAKGDFDGARELYQRALALLTPLGEHEKTGVVLNNMAITYENQGRMTDAQKLFRRAAETWTQCGDLLHAGVALGNLGDVLMVRGQLHEAELQYDRARKQIEAVGSDSDVPYLLYSVASIRLSEGDVAGAKQYTEQAMAIARRGKNVNDIAGDSEVIGAIQIAADDLAGAHQTFQQALDICRQQANKGSIAGIEVELAEVSLEAGKFSEAEQTLRKSLAEFRAENAVLEEIETETDLSRSLLHENKLAGARQAVSDAIALSATTRDPNLKLPAAIMDARVQVAELSARANAKSKPDFAVPRHKLSSVVATAHRLGYYQIECDARLALAELDLRESVPSARAHLARLASDARRHGLNLISRKVATLADSATASSRRVVSQLR